MQSPGLFIGDYIQPLVFGFVALLYALEQILFRRRQLFKAGVQHAEVVVCSCRAINLENGGFLFRLLDLLKRYCSACSFFATGCIYAHDMLACGSIMPNVSRPAFLLFQRLQKRSIAIMIVAVSQLYNAKPLW